MRTVVPLFAAHAEKYWSVNLPAIPLYYHDKKPAIPDWSRFKAQMPTPQEQSDWVQRFQDNNIGVALGPQSGLTMIDIDTENENLVRDIISVLPPSVWHRKGRKGLMLAYKFSGIQTFRIKDAAGAMIVECLSAGTQIVLPPSIHPDTKLPYVANCELYEVLGKLGPLDPGVEEKLRSLISGPPYNIPLSHSGWTKVTDFVSVGSRDVKMTAIAGLFAAGITKGELSLMDAIERMRAWHQLCVDKIAGDDIDIEKGVNNLIKFLVRDVLDKDRYLPAGWDAGLSDEDKQNMGLMFTIDNEEWNYEQLVEHLQSAFEEHKAETPGRMAAIEYVLKKISQSERLGSLDVERTLKYITDAGQMRLTVANLKTRVRELQRGELVGINHFEIAENLAKDLAEVTPYSYTMDKFWMYNGSNWEKVPENELLRTVAQKYGHMPACKKQSDHNGVLKVLKTLLPQTLGDDRVAGLNFANGVLLETGQMVDHSASYGFSYTLPYRYIPGIGREAVRWSQFLDRIWGTEHDWESRVRSLQETMCATLFGMGPRYQKAMLCYGAAATGKTQLLTILQNLLPEDARSSAPPEAWGDKFMPTTMFGKVLNSCGELSERKIIDGQRFKSIIDGEEMPGQYKNGQIFQFKPIATHWFASNFLPKTDDASVGFTRRWIIYSFNRPIKDHEKILNFGDIVAAEEREAIVSWLVEALPQLQQSARLSVPDSHLDYIEEVACANNSVRAFLMRAEAVRVNEAKQEMAPIKEVYAAYWTFCLADGGQRQVTPQVFRRRMRELGIEFGFQEVLGGWIGIELMKRK